VAGGRSDGQAARAPNPQPQRQAQRQRQPPLQQGEPRPRPPAPRLPPHHGHPAGGPPAAPRALPAFRQRQHNRQGSDGESSIL